MCVDLVLCEKKAKELQDSDHRPRKDNGKKEGLMNLILWYWNNMGYQHLKHTAQNLRDKLAHIKRSTKVTASQITEEIQLQQNHQLGKNTENEESIFCLNISSARTTEDQNGNYCSASRP